MCCWFIYLCDCLDHFWVDHYFGLDFLEKYKDYFYVFNSNFHLMETVNIHFTDFIRILVQILKMI